MLFARNYINGISRKHFKRVFQVQNDAQVHSQKIIRIYIEGNLLRSFCPAPAQSRANLNVRAGCTNFPAEIWKPPRIEIPRFSRQSVLALNHLHGEFFPHIQFPCNLWLSPLLFIVHFWEESEFSYSPFGEGRIAIKSPFVFSSLLRSKLSSSLVLHHVLQSLLSLCDPHNIYDKWYSK